jgi:hypothetical protein
MLAAIETVANSDAIWLPRSRDPDIAAQAPPGELAHAASPFVYPDRKPEFRS